MLHCKKGRDGKIANLFYSVKTPAALIVYQNFLTCSLYLCTTSSMLETPSRHLCFTKNSCRSLYLYTTSSMLETPTTLFNLSKPHDMVLLPLYDFVNVGDAGPPSLFYKKSPDMVPLPLYNFVNFGDAWPPSLFYKISPDKVPLPLDDFVNV